MTKKPALFLDRDGVINLMVKGKDGTYDSPYTKEDIALVPGIEEIITFCNQLNIPVVIISNQPGVAKEKTTLEELYAVHDAIIEKLKESSAFIHATYFCLHHENGTNETYTSVCSCRKPNPGLLLQAAQEHSLDLSSSLFLGDTLSDMQAGRQAGCATLLFLHTQDTEEKNKKKLSYKGDTVSSLKEAHGFIKTFFTHE